MFEGLSTEAPFGGGEAEGTWRGFLVDAMAKQAVRGGGIGLADQVVAQMLKMQEQGQ
jgi:Rod binding domain-containing protein